MTEDESIAQRFWSKVLRPSLFECWLWHAASSTNGYGRFRVHARMVRAHRLAYELEVGPIPDGLELDHLCRNHACVNPAHLEPVTHLVNMQRGRGGEYLRMKTHCPQGHPYAGSNLRLNKKGARCCRACDVERCRRNRARKQEH